MGRNADQAVMIERHAPATAGAAHFDLATPADDAEIRRLLAENPMDGAIRLSLEPAPGVDLRDAEPGEIVRQVLVGRRRGGGLFGIGVRSVREIYVNGIPQPVGYLGGLRLDRDYRHRPRVMLEGYHRLRELHEADGACRFYLTSIMSDNAVARRVLEVGLRGMPTYRFIGELVSLVMRVRRRMSSSQGRALRRFGLRIEEGGVERLPAIVALLERSGRRFQFSP